MPSRRFLSIWLRRLSTDRLTRARGLDPARPLVVTADVKSARRLIGMNDAAAGFGFAPGLTLADARAMFPDIDIAEADPAADFAVLETIADWCDRYTPLVGLDAPDGLALDMTGCAHLFGGEAAMLRDIVRRLAANGLKAHGAIADTYGAAWALSHYGAETFCIASADRTREALVELPLAALRLAPELVATLNELGLKRIGDIIERPRAPLAARFGEILLRRLDQALGRHSESIVPRLPVPSYVVEQRFADPIAREDDILGTAAHLAQRLAPLLEQRGEGAREFELAIFRIDGCVRRLCVATSRPTRDWAFVRRLFAEKLAGLSDDHDPGFGFDLVRLSVTQAERCDPAALGFGEADVAAEMAQLVDRLGARFGAERVQRLELRDTHIPEFAVAAVSVASTERGWSNDGRDGPSQEDNGIKRPLRLFERPERIEAMAEIPDGPPVRFRWRRVLHEIAHSEGPERIAMEWWRDDCGRALTRDYFRVENGAGARFWIFREGLYERETAQPRWFIHGLLA